MKKMKPENWIALLFMFGYIVLRYIKLNGIGIDHDYLNYYLLISCVAGLYYIKQLLSRIRNLEGKS